MTESPRVRCVVAWQSWPAELAREWLGVDFPEPQPAACLSVQALLQEAAPLLSGPKDDEQAAQRGCGQPLVRIPGAWHDQPSWGDTGGGRRPRAHCSRP